MPKNISFRVAANSTELPYTALAGLGPIRFGVACTDWSDKDRKIEKTIWRATKKAARLIYSNSQVQWQNIYFERKKSGNDRANMMKGEKL